jgi:hypothetical protein
MGFFSWKTQDTNRSIANHHSGKSTFDVFMIDNKGNKWKESNYDGYGEFGGKDFHELLAEMNGLESDRMAGINLQFSGQPFISPNLVENPNEVWIDEMPKMCECQGFFY